ncbi:MAG: hypothetical protein E6G60_14595 [Actinobacteria bacterium]|nr:MAG: hypothetical protein E6G60_14595 [Actinomycetota bacterium]
MSVDERRRLQLAEAAKRALGNDEAVTLMELLPPVGWGDVATKQDLQRLEIDMQRLAAATRQDMLLFEARLEARFERGFRQVVVTTSSLLVTGFIATVVATIVAR